MGVSAPNNESGSHVSGGVLQGYCVRVHQSNIGLDTRSPDVPWSDYRRVLVAARSASDAALNDIAVEVFGPWWTQQVVNRGVLAGARLQLIHYLPPNVPIPG